MQGGSLAYKEYQQSKDKARFKQLSQKLAQHLNHLSEDLNTRIRWIWELIQNAKDVPNQFNKTRMRIEIKDTKLIFAHNGDPFRVSDLESIVAQYSSKPEENKASEETTGKYGTGFITTYILSKKVRIKGLLSVKTEEEAKKQKDEQSSDEEMTIVNQSRLVGKRQPKKYEKSQEEDEEQNNQIEEMQDVLRMKKKSLIKEKVEEEDNEGMKQYAKHQSKENKRSKLNFQGGSLYQRFEIYLDRDYKDRDKELFKKLMQTEHNLMEDLLKNKPEPKWQRKEIQLNTQFIYEELDEAAFSMINDSMVCLKELFAYAILFNPKIYEIQVIDKRKKKTIKNFGIKRIDETKLNGLNIFNVSLLSEGEDNKTFSLAYLEDDATSSVIAMPLFIEGQKVRLMELNHKLPKIFKEFPLIGCNDTGFNFVFQSKKFYPNETRSNLLLKEIQGRNSNKPKSNWSALKAIFIKAKQMYHILSKTITEGHQHLLILTLKNLFTLEQYADKKMVHIYQQIIEEVQKGKYIEFKNEKIGSLRDLRYPIGKSEAKDKDDKEYSNKMNDIFESLNGENHVLNKVWHEKFYGILNSKKDIWENHVKYLTVENCLEEFNKLDFMQLVYKTGDKEKALNILEEIYKFVEENHPRFLNPKTAKQKENKKGQQEIQNKPYHLSFILTNEYVFRDLLGRDGKQYLKKKIKISRGYEQIAQILKIRYNENIILDRFAKYFEKVEIFSLDHLLKLFRDYFFIFHQEQSQAFLVTLGRFLLTVGIVSPGIQIAFNIKGFKDIKSQFKLSTQDEQIKLNPKLAEEFTVLFQLKLLRLIAIKMKDCDKLVELMHYLTFKLNDSASAVQWFDSVLGLQENLLKKETAKEIYKVVFNEAFKNEIIVKNLTMNELFRPTNKMQVFCKFQYEKVYKGNYPNLEDRRIYQKMRNIHYQTHNYTNYGNLFNYAIFSRGKQKSRPRIVQLQELIQHEKITHKFPKSVYFKDKFKFIPNLYLKHELVGEQKLQFINYLDKLIQQNQSNKDLAFKLQPFGQVIDRMYYDYAAQTKCLKNRKDRQFMFHLLKNPKKIETLREMSSICEFKEALEIVKEHKSKQMIPE